MDVAAATLVSSAPHRLLREQLIPRPRREVFPFFADAGNLERITPPFLNFRILTPQPIAMAPGTLIDYRLRLFGLPFRWRTRIERFEPERLFVDVQLAGPYRLWHHLHEFEDVSGGTLVRDTVDYDVGWGALGALVHVALVRRTLDEIFDFRQQEIARLLG